MTKIAVAVGIIVLIIGVGIAISQFPKYFEPEPVACTMEARLCPDGSYVGRTGPKCEFTECNSLIKDPDCPGPACDNFGLLGNIFGKVSIGPLCPVEPCPVLKTDPYSSRKVVLTTKSGVEYLFNLDFEGNFSADLLVGTYEVTITDCDFLGCRYSLPKIVTIEAYKPTRIDIDIDTGIR